jgi:chemotaxis protein methyltransferase CheR
MVFTGKTSGAPQTMQSTPPLSEIYNDGSNEGYSQAELKKSDFEQISQIVYQSCGIRLTAGKEELVRSRLLKRLRALSIRSFKEYLQHVMKNKEADEFRIMIDCLTTNKTSFFRESRHFDFLRDRILPGIRKSKKGIRIWSAGCSTGEEPYSIAMLLREELAAVDPSMIRILATDISERVLAKARAGEYEKQMLDDIPKSYLMKCFSSVPSPSTNTCCINDQIKSMVRFARLNLMELWPMKGPFDVIFCRNVMIYFDSHTQQKLVQRFWDILAPGGHLLVGHSESLVANITGFKYVEPATYLKPKE